MPQFVCGDELGSIKTVKFTQSEDKTWQSAIVSVRAGSEKTGAIQKMALVASEGKQRQLASVHADGSTCLINFNDEGKGEEQARWRESRLKTSQRFVGLAFADGAVLSCTSNGALRRTVVGEDAALETHLATLPMRIAEFSLSPDARTFAYAGDEVELSVWDAERAFDAPEASSTAETLSQSKKRKRNDHLLPHEIWRAKNLPNDNLNLRQPVRNSALTYLPITTQPSQQLLAGTQLGDVRRYDTRAGRRPVSNWTGLGKVGGIGQIEVGLCEYDVFFSDDGCNLSSLDLRNGKIPYGYKGISGAVSSIAPAPSFLASGAADRFLRLHSTFPPPTIVGAQQEQKGEVLDKVYMKVVPSVVLWDGQSTAVTHEGAENDDEGDDAVWTEMQEVDSGDEQKTKKAKKL